MRKVGKDRWMKNGWWCGESPGYGRPEHCSKEVRAVSCMSSFSLGIWDPHHTPLLADEQEQKDDQASDERQADPDDGSGIVAWSCGRSQHGDSPTSCMAQWPCRIYCPDSEPAESQGAALAQSHLFSAAFSCQDSFHTDFLASCGHHFLWV